MFTAIFDSKGKLIRKVSEPEDDELSQRAIAGDATVLTPTGYGNISQDLGTIVMGSDGKAYLMRAVSPALVYAVTANGEVTRKFYIDPGEPGLPPASEGLKTRQGKLTLLFSSRARDAAILKVVDLMGNPVQTFALDTSSLWPRMDCYAPPNITFLTPVGSYTENAPMHLIQAEVK